MARLLNYKDFLDKSRSKRVLGDALKEAYSDIFTIRASPKKEDKDIIEGKFKSTHNLSNNTAKLSAATFLGLLDQADISGDTLPKEEKNKVSSENNKSSDTPLKDANTQKSNDHKNVGLHYNIQIHLPPSKDIEVYNAIFKSLKEHLLD